MTTTVFEVWVGEVEHSYGTEFAGKVFATEHQAKVWANKVPEHTVQRVYVEGKVASPASVWLPHGSEQPFVSEAAYKKWADAEGVAEIGGRQVPLYGCCDSCGEPNSVCASCKDCDCCVYHMNGGNAEYCCGPEMPTGENNRLRQLLYQLEEDVDTGEEEDGEGDGDGDAYVSSEDVDKWNRVDVVTGRK